MTLEIDKLLENNKNIPPALSRLIADAAGLLWRMRRNDRQIEFLNPSKDGLFADPEEVKRLLGDLIHASQIVQEDDFFRFKLAIKNIRDGLPTLALFRVRDNGRPFRWVKMVGAPGEQTQEFYYGFIRDITEDVIHINQLLEKDLARQTMLQQLDFPALLVDMKSKAVISRNTHAYNFFQYDFDEFNHLTLRDLYPSDHESLFIKAYETSVMEGVWEGPLQLKTKSGGTPQVIARLKRLAIQDRELLRISIPQILSLETGEGADAAPPLEKDAFLQHLIDAVTTDETIAQIPDILNRLKSNPYAQFQIEALMVVDLQAPRKKPNIHVVGESFALSDFQSHFNFEGAIMQDIRQRRVEHVILEDTLESTRPIDWALFIPYGIRSYFVKPYFFGSKLRHLLFFCSTEVGAFSEKQLDVYQMYSKAFIKGLRKWRKRPRRKAGAFAPDETPDESR